ncbi:Bifunctional ligase/repressor BirA [Defluviimonas aquaemixtae]|uniref:Bifunctional ligase/repressor BirA n=1 Tax=Albidovulum aquaemixtae TaxID=1542388 RepID=A0A2R8B420_9RHOB|nr:HTH domain-containing protein [Defluviimonas aquaemixtae]SPH17359.1 Bifunctional ligase/repressor BirA [Defluviimonas aquaemixtae]
MRRKDRLFDLVQILRDGKLHRAADLARRTGVSTRTIWRDMAALGDSGLPIEGARGIGYQLRDPTVLPPMALTRDEFEALRLGVALVAGAADPTIARAAASLRAKISAVAPARAQDPGADSFVFASEEAARGAPHLGLIRRAIRDHLTLTLTYAGRAAGRIRPLHLDYWGRAWTLTAWSDSLSDFNVFRVDLVTSIEHDGGAFLPEHGKTVEDYLARVTRR